VAKAKGRGNENRSNITLLVLLPCTLKDNNLKKTRILRGGRKKQKRMEEQKGYKMPTDSPESSIMCTRLEG
jgi:hypothetical protein